MRFDYVTMTEAIGGDATRAEGLRGRATSHRTRRTTRSEARGRRPPRALPTRRLDGVTCHYGAAIRCSSDVTLERRSRAVHRRRRVRRARARRRCCARSRARSGRAPAAVDRRPGLRVGYVPQVETVNWSFPVTVGECVLMARHARALAAVDELGRARRGRGRARAARPRGTRQAPHPRALGRPAAARLHRARIAPAPRAPAARRAHVGRRREAPARGPPPARRPERRRRRDRPHHPRSQRHRRPSAHASSASTARWSAPGAPTTCSRRRSWSAPMARRMQVLEHAGMPVVVDSFPGMQEPAVPARSGT